MELSNAIRQRIIMLADERNVKLSTIIRKSGVNRHTVMHFMHGKTKLPNLSTLNQLCLKGFEIPMKEFFKEEYFNNVITEDKKEKRRRRSKKKL